MSDHRQLRVRFYPTAGKWLCAVQQLGADGMPGGDDLVSATRDTKDDARQAAIEAAEDPEVAQFHPRPLNELVHGPEVRSYDRLASEELRRNLAVAIVKAPLGSLNLLYSP